jgi:glycosyltransferase involved in cell wall biosynthesis
VYREILGDAAFLAAPDKPVNLAEAMYNVLADRELSAARVKKGYACCKLFSWPGSAAKIINVIEELRKEKL